MKKLLLSFLALSVSAAGFAAGPYSISIGSGAGQLTINNIYSNGYIQGDTGAFNPTGAGTGFTVFRNWFMVHNATDNTTFWADGFNSGIGYPSHDNKIPDGPTPTSNATGFSNTGINYGNSLTGDLVASLSSPVVAGSTAVARLAFQWTFYNAAASAKDVRLVWDLDYDGYIVGGYTNDLVARTGNTFTSGLALAQGESASGNVDLNPGIKMESSVPITAFYGVAHVDGSGYYWSNENTYLNVGPEVQKAIHSSHANTIENDATNNGLTDTPRDTAGILQVNLNVPASGNSTVTLYATWGLDTTIGANSAVSEWQLY
jgi:hypothetical protein